MNREIKFRVFDKENRKWLGEDEFFITNEDVWAYAADFDNSSPLDMEKHELVQYTGLKDKNGVEIYEGDIVTWLSRNFGKVFGTAEEDEPEWIEETRQIKYRKQEFNVPQGTIRELKVIGNIHQHPHLLGGVDE